MSAVPRFGGKFRTIRQTQQNPILIIGCAAEGIDIKHIKSGIGVVYHSRFLSALVNCSKIKNVRLYRLYGKRIVFGGAGKAGLDFRLIPEIAASVFVIVAAAPGFYAYKLGVHSRGSPYPQG